jgi:Na+/melibiose symporter-like transporter
MIVPVLFTAAALALVVVYPLSEKRAKEIRESLETRRGAT